MKATALPTGVDKASSPATKMKTKDNIDTREEPSRSHQNRTFFFMMTRQRRKQSDIKNCYPSERRSIPRSRRQRTPHLSSQPSYVRWLQPL